MSEYPSRASSHLLESASDRFLRNAVPISWVLNKPIDYGLDYYVDIAEDQQLSGLNFSIQLKAHAQLSEKGEAIIVLKRSTINMYLNRLEPILLICYIENENEAYFDWFRENTVDLTKSHEKNYIKINKSNKISKLNWDDITAHVKKIFSRKFLLNSLPEIDLTEITDVDEKAAMGSYLRGDFEKAEQQYKKLLKKEKKITWLSALAMSQYSLYRYKDALITINSALERCDIPELWMNKASILAEDGISSRDKAKLLEAKSIFSQAISIYDDPHHYYNYANTLNELGEYESAQQYYKKALKINPNYAQAWKNLGEVYFRTHQHKKEKEAYENALKIDPDLPEALISLGILMVRNEEDFKQGLQLMKRAADTSPDLFNHFQMGNFWFAKAYFGLEEYETGYRYIQKGLSLFPGNVYLLDLKKEYYYRNWQSDKESAPTLIEFLKFRIDLDGRDLENFSMLIEVYLAQNEYDEVLRLLDINTNLLKGVDKETIINSNIPLDKYLLGLPSYPEYAQFRQRTASRRVEVYFIDQRIEWIIDLMGLATFHNALKVCKDVTIRNRELQVTDLVMKCISENFPLCAPLMFSADESDPEQVATQMTDAIVHIPTIAMIEAGILLGELGVRFKFSDKKMERALSDKKEKKIFGDISMACVEAIQRAHKIFPQD